EQDEGRDTGDECHRDPGHQQRQQHGDDHRRNEQQASVRDGRGLREFVSTHQAPAVDEGDRKSTRLNSSHVSTSYAVFSLKKKTMTKTVLSTTLARRECGNASRMLFIDNIIGLRVVT